MTLPFIFPKTPFCDFSVQAFFCASILWQNAEIPCAAAQAICAMERSDARDIPIFALSADAFVEAERASIESGMDGHFAKPIDFNLLRQGALFAVYFPKKEHIIYKKMPENPCNRLSLVIDCVL